MNTKSLGRNAGTMAIAVLLGLPSFAWAVKCSDYKTKSECGHISGCIWGNVNTGKKAVVKMGCMAEKPDPTPSQKPSSIPKKYKKFIKN